MQRSKYRAQRTDGYASKKEAARASELRVMLKCGIIRNLQEQVKFELIPEQEGERACTYVADFMYEHTVDGSVVIEDVKGYQTPEFKIKKKLMLWRHGIRVFMT
jgi:hypothetical protein